jgi:hypothetical protein
MDREAAFRYLTDYWALVNNAQKLPYFSKERRAAVRAANEHLIGFHRADKVADKSWRAPRWTSGTATSRARP